MIAVAVVALAIPLGASAQSAKPADRMKELEKR